MSIALSLVVARGRNGVIGRAGGLPWRLGSDLKHFKAVTLGKPVLMGRKTWEGLALRPLPGRPNLVLSRDGGFTAPGAWVYADLGLAIAAGRAMARLARADEVALIGGAALYAQALPLADIVRLTEVDAAPDGDAFFPPFDESAFRETARADFPAGRRDDHAFTLRTLVRRS